MPARKIRTATEARRLLDAAASSGLSRTAWCHANGVNARSLNAWRLNLQPRETHALRLVELVAAPATSVSPPVRVVCGPFVVDIDPRHDDLTLRRVLALVASCSV